MDKNLFKGTFTSVWSEGTVTTSCMLNYKLGSLSPETADVGDMGTLVSEKFVTTEGDEYEVCPVCHEYILKGKMFNDATGNGQHEKMVCADPNCESHEPE
jgi:hypothetical protein